MPVSYQIVIPVYTWLPHIEKNLESLNDWEHLLLVDNSKDGWLKKYEGRGAKIVYRPENIGVSRAWNLGIKEGKDYTFFVSSSVFWPLGFAELRNHLEQLIAEKAPGIEYGLFCNLAWHANALSQKTIEKVGFFDTNFYPSYYEDTDMCRRLYLAGIHPNVEGHTRGGVVPIVVVSASPIEIATTLKRAGLQVPFNKLAQHYKNKWGGNKPNETFDLPWGDKPLGYWPEKSIETLKQEYGLD